jgi:hypothetical protein
MIEMNRKTFSLLRKEKKKNKRARTHTPESPKFSSSTRQPPPHLAFVDCELHNHQRQVLSPNPPPVSAILDRFFAILDRFL